MAVPGDLAHLRDAVEQRRHLEQVGRRAMCRSRTSALLRSGRLKKEPCEWCGEARAQAHHEDYEQPQHVRWLCRECHHAVHHRGLTLPSKESLRTIRIVVPVMVGVEMGLRGRMPAAVPIFLTIAEVLTLTGRSEADVAGAIKAGTLVPFCGRCRRSWRIRQRDVDEWMRAAEAAPRGTSEKRQRTSEK